MELEESHLAIKDLKTDIHRTIADLAAVDDENRSFDPADFRVLARGLKLTLLALSGSIGECQSDVPYSPMRPVRQPDGTLRWCCNHDPEHCS